MLNEGEILPRGRNGQGMHYALSHKFLWQIVLNSKTNVDRMYRTAVNTYVFTLYKPVSYFRAVPFVSMTLISSVLGLRKQKLLWVHNWSTTNDRFLKVISIDLVHAKNSKITIMIWQMFSFNVRNHFASTMSSTFTQLQKGSRFVYKLHRMKEQNTYDNLNGKQQYL